MVNKDLHNISYQGTDQVYFMQTFEAAIRNEEVLVISLILQSDFLFVK